ncbi:MAG: AAA family ATPase [Ruminococcus sp.]|nr:AAA family ATPase [Ruminococcus sp.]
MIKFAIYGKGGIGKSTMACNISAALALKGMRVMQIGCDPKADSTSLLHGGERVRTVLELIREKGVGKVELEETVHVSEQGVICVEAGGPVPGLGCAGRGIISALETLERLGAYEKYRPDVVIYDVLGDVVCGGFSMPMRKGYADKVFVVTSGEKMSRYAAANICMAVENFKGRGYAALGGIILNRRSVAGEDESVAELAEDFSTKVIGTVDRSEDITAAEEKGQTLVTVCPESRAACQIRETAERIVQICGGKSDA